MTEPFLIRANSLPPDHAERRRALDPERSFLVQAPAGSGKTYLLTQRFLRLLGLVEKPDEIVAITFTNAAAAEMRGRILDELLRAEVAGPQVADADAESLGALAWAALERGRRMDWQLLDQPGQLRILTIDAFCRALALQSPLSWGALAELGGKLDPVNDPEDLYRRAAGRTLELLKRADSPVRRSVEELLLWRDNYWKDVEDLLVRMLGERNRWFKDFVFLQGVAEEEDWLRLRERLERPFRRETLGRLTRLGSKLEGLGGSREFALKLAREACETPGKSSPTGLAERVELPDCSDVDLANALEAYGELARFLLTSGGTWRKKGGLNVNHGYLTTPAGKAAKERFAEFVEGLALEPGLEAALGAFLAPMPIGYSDEEWGLIRHCFAVMRVAAAELRVVFAETGSVDFTEVAQIALQAFAPADGFPSEFALRVAEGIRHLLVDEFQDTSRNQHELLARLVGAWAEREGRSVFCVGDPMQSIYGFREAEVELFERLKTHGLEAEEPLRLEFVSLSANFRTVPGLVEDLNRHFARIFAEEDGSGVQFSLAVAARAGASDVKTELHLAFTRNARAADEDSAEDLPGNAEASRREQLAELVGLIRGRLERAQTDGLKRFRIAVLGRTKRSLMMVAEALRDAGISFRAVDVVPLRERPEVLDALALVRALLNPVDRTAWLGVLRAPWCGLSLSELHLLTSADNGVVMAQPVPQLLDGRLAEFFAKGLLNSRAFAAASRVGRILRETVEVRTEAATETLGTWVESVWKALGGEFTVDREQRENLRLVWRCLDRLPEGEVDLLGPGLDASLDSLFALPDPEANPEFGVQLMTIHKSKGLEFEVVIVPDLEARGGHNKPELLSWLERGLAEGEEGGELTEFLIAPIQTKGSDAGATKKWVDGVRKARETQEMRRILYVAATRAREELHLFARPRFTDKKGELVLAPASGLMATAWPAFQEMVEGGFSRWVANSSAEFVESLAAQGALLEMPAKRRERPTLVRRMPEGFVAPEFRGYVSAGVGAAGGVAPVYERTEGGLQSRLLGTAIHALLERLSKLREMYNTAEALTVLAESAPSVTARMRERGLTLAAAQRLADEALAVAHNVALDAEGAWILAPHAKGETEAQWTGMVRHEDGHESLANLRPDRVFFAAGLHGAEAGWWILDYKTSHAGGRDLSDETERLAFLRRHREQHEGQLAAYAQVLRRLQGVEDMPVRAGIYYPRLRLLDSWKA